eukprot:TRINITY_DN3688_c0_g1_i2.p1 TRINITY_DN3688_c0_g1~~TRINITY_DN3688_c0_g1_i2.p1  ORF type:complete len:434 (+),score=58.73 TRINITY_DN3688_c0_g1_i2:77-1378(+)
MAAKRPLDDVATQVTKRPETDGDFAELLKLFYLRLFPFRQMYQWLSYSDAEYFHRREFSITLKGDIYVRYLCFPSPEAFRQEICTKCPEKIDIGAVYSALPKDHKAIPTGFKPVERELVFDIDMTDYDKIRTCCKGAQVCKKCWVWMSCAIHVVDRAMEEDFGFKHRLWVYSGRRGVHCWIGDKRARLLSNEQRSAIADYMNVFTSGDNRAMLKGISHLHPRVEAAASELEPYFVDQIAAQQGLFEDQALATSLLDMIPDEAARGEINHIWFVKSPNLNTKERWDVLVDQVKRAQQGRGVANARALSCCVKEIILWYTYPRLDVNVSKGMNHLLKSPFCVHPKTGNVCVPLDPHTCDEFDPLVDPPSIYSLPAEIDAYDQSHPASPGARKIKDYKKTKMLQAINIFKKSFLRPLQQTIGKERAAAQAANSLTF